MCPGVLEHDLRKAGSDPLRKILAKSNSWPELTMDLPTLEAYQQVSDSWHAYATLWDERLLSPEGSSFHGCLLCMAGRVIVGSEKCQF